MLESDIVFVSLAGGTQICRIPAGTLVIQCHDNFDGAPSGSASVPFSGLSDGRLVVTRFQDASYGYVREDLWAGDCTGHTWSVMPAPYSGGEASTSSGAFSLAGSNLALAFFRSTSTIPNGDPTCPSDAPPATAPNMDFRFEGDTRTDVSGHGYTVTSAGTSFVNSPSYNPAVIITGSWVAPRPVVAVEPFSVDCSKSVTSTGNGVPVSYAWSQTAGPGGSFSMTNVAAPTFTPSADGSYTLQCVARDGGGNSGTGTINVGVVDSDLKGIKIPTNAELDWIMGPIPRYGTSPWPWFEQTEVMDADVLAPYYYAPPSPGTLFTGPGVDNAYFSSRGPFTGALTDTYDVKISAVGTPDSYQWRKNGGSWSASIPIVTTQCWGQPKTNPVTDGVIICFNSNSGHTLNSMWTRQAPFEGTGSITGTGNNHIDPATGYVCGGASGGCGISSITVVGTGTHWATGTATQKVSAGTTYWFEWDAAGDGSNQGRFAVAIQSVVDDTHITIYANAGTWPIPVSRSSSIKIQTIGLDFSVNYTGGGQNTNGTLNYYEAILGLGRLAEATNLDVYTNEFRAACDLWWQYGLDHGFNIVVQRNSGWQSMMACASKFHYNWWDGLAYNIAYSLNLKPAPINRDDPLTDIREDSYATRAEALMAHVYPPHAPVPATARATWCGYVRDQVNNVWLNPASSGGMYSVINSGQDAYWQDNLLKYHIQYPAAGNPPGHTTLTVYGTSPWRDSGLVTIANTETYRVLSNPSDCNTDNGVLAASVQTADKLSASFMWDYGRAPDGGLYYNVLYASMQGVRLPTDVIHNTQTNGLTAVNIAVAGTSVVGDANSQFLRRFAPCNGTSRIIINGGSPIPVSSCADDTHLTLASSGGSYAGTNWVNDSTIAVTNGSATVTGIRTGFINMFAPCDGTTYLAIHGATNADNAVYRVVACPSNTSLTLNAVYTGASQSAQAEYAMSKASLSSCSPSIATQCEPIAGGGTALAHDWAVSLGQMYQWTGDPMWRTRLEYGLGSLYGGPSGGPSALGPNSGPQSSLGPSNFDEPIPSCFTTAAVQPCQISNGHGDGYFFGHAAKAFGMSAGAGNARAAIAHYLNIRQAEDRFGAIRRGETVRQDTVR